MRKRPDLVAVASRAAALVTLALTLAPAHVGLAFEVFPLPPAGRFTMNLNLGRTIMPTGRGDHSWNSLAEAALARWNEVGVGPDQDHGFFSTTTSDIADSFCDRSDVNHVMFVDGRVPQVLCGLDFPAGAVALTITYQSRTERLESDVVVNDCYTFGAYPGPLVSGSPSPCGDRTVYDIYRILLHEFGHVVGLDHPDEAGQQVVALMNRSASDIDDLEPDDIAGARAIDWRNSPITTFVTNFYTTILGRSPAPLELDGWVAFLRANPTRADLIVQGFFHSAEFAHTRAVTLEEYVGLLYRTVLLRSPGPSETAAWVPVVVDRLDRLVPGFVNSPEFQTVLATTPAADVIRRFYQNVLGRTPSGAEVDVWLAALQEGGASWQVVAVGFLSSAEYVAGRRTFADHVRVLYRMFLGRTPSNGEVDGWLGALFAQLADVEAAFVGSAEFGAIASQF